MLPDGVRMVWARDGVIVPGSGAHTLQFSSVSLCPHAVVPFWPIRSWRSAGRRIKIQLCSDRPPMKEKLLNQGTDAGQRAIRHYLNKEYDQFFVQAGVSFELLGKARLAAIHPSLIIDKDFDSFLHACAAAKHSKRPPWNIKTISAPEVLRRCTQLHPELSDFGPRLTLLAEFRNSTIHLGEVPEVEVTQLLRAYLAGTAELMKGLELKHEDIFGDFTEMVAKQLDESLAEVQRAVAEKVARAISDYQGRYAGLDQGQMKALISVIEGRYKAITNKYEDDLVSCPACEHLGIASGEFNVDWEADYDDESGSPTGAYPVVTLKPSAFVCEFCGLQLSDTSELRAAGLPESINIEDIEPSDFYEDPDSV
jgi:hypothetical protein